MKVNYFNIARASLFAASIVGISAYMAQTSHHLLAGLLITIPIPFFSLWFIEKHPEHMKEYIKGFSISIILYCIVALFFSYSVLKLDYQKRTMILFSVGLWFFLLSMCYIYFK